MIELKVQSKVKKKPIREIEREIFPWIFFFAYITIVRGALCTGAPSTRIMIYTSVCDIMLMRGFKT